MKANLTPTPYPEVNAILVELLYRSRQILGEAFVGMYLCGSLSSGDFDLRSSDIDFVVVTEDYLPENLVSRLAELHTSLWSGGSKWARKLEGSYVPRHLIHQHNSGARPCPTVNEGKLFSAQLGPDWVFQRRILREQGVILDGPPPQNLILPVTDEQVRQAEMDLFHEWWQPMLEDLTFLRRSEYCAFAVLSMCRCLYTLKHGAIASKPVSARWARQELGSNWGGIIDKALSWPDEAQVVSPDEALALIRLVKEYIDIC